MNKIKVETIKEIVNILEQQIAESETNYSADFVVGDLVYYINSEGNIVQAIIDEIYSSRYFIHEVGSKIGIWNHIKWWILLHIDWVYINYNLPKGYPGHAVNAGEDIFRTKQEAEDNLLLHNILYDLLNYRTRYLTEK